jgi:hypothetical protein
VADLSSADLACGRNHTDPFVADVINVRAGAEVGAFWWGHVIGMCVCILLMSDVIETSPLIDRNEGENYYGNPITSDHRGAICHGI